MSSLSSSTRRHRRRWSPCWSLPDRSPVRRSPSSPRRPARRDRVRRQRHRFGDVGDLHRVGTVVGHFPDDRRLTGIRIALGVGGEHDRRAAGAGAARLRSCSRSARCRRRLRVGRRRRLGRLRRCSARAPAPSLGRRLQAPAQEWVPGPLPRVRRQCTSNTCQHHHRQRRHQADDRASGPRRDAPPPPRCVRRHRARSHAHPLAPRRSNNRADFGTVTDDRGTDVSYVMTSLPPAHDQG